MKPLLSIIILVALAGFAYAQTTPIPNQIADIQVQKAKDEIDKFSQRIINDNVEINSAETTVYVDQQGLLQLASQGQPLQSAVDLCNSNPAQYCPGWVVPTPPTPPTPILITDPSKVNWNVVALLRASGDTNWQDIQTIVSGVNWQAVNAINGINWQSINIAGINWNDWTAQEAQGVNWAQWILNGGK